jgi:hypothetical protein
MYDTIDHSLQSQTDFRLQRIARTAVAIAEAATSPLLPPATMSIIIARAKGKLTGACGAKSKGKSR